MSHEGEAFFRDFKHLRLRLNSVAFFMLPWPRRPAGTTLGHNELLTLSQPAHPQPSLPACGHLLWLQAFLPAGKCDETQK